MTENVPWHTRSITVNITKSKHLIYLNKHITWIKRYMNTEVEMNYAASEAKRNIH